MLDAGVLAGSTSIVADSPAHVCIGDHKIQEFKDNGRVTGPAGNHYNEWATRPVSIVVR